MDKQPSIEERLSAVLEREEAPPVQAEAPEVEAPAVEAPEAEPKAEAAPEEDEGVEMSTFNELVEFLEVEPDALYKLQLSVDTPDGPESVTLESLKDGYRNAVKLQRQQAEIEAKRIEFETQQQQFAEAFEARERQAAELLNHAEQTFLQDFARVDWATLERTDPGRFAMLRMQYSERQQQFAQIRHQAALRYESTQRELSETKEARQRELMQKEVQALYAAIPEWSNPEVAEKEKAEIGAFLLSRGYTREDIKDKLLAKDILLAREAMAYQKSKKVMTEAAKNKVLKLGKKVLKSGPRQTKGEASERETTLRSQLRKSGDYRDAARLISAMRD